MLRGLFFQAWGFLTSLKSQTQDPQLNVPPGVLVLRIFMSWKYLSTSAGWNLQALDLLSLTPSLMKLESVSANMLSIHYPVKNLIQIKTSHLFGAILQMKGPDLNLIVPGSVVDSIYIKKLSPKPGIFFLLNIYREHAILWIFASAWNWCPRIIIEHSVSNPHWVIMNYFYCKKLKWWNNIFYIIY